MTVSTGHFPSKAEMLEYGLFAIFDLDAAADPAADGVDLGERLLDYSVAGRVALGIHVKPVEFVVDDENISIPES